MTQCETHLPRCREDKSTRIIATCKLTTDQWACFLLAGNNAADPLEDQDAWGTGRNDHAHRGNIIVLITKDGYENLTNYPFEARLLAP